MPPKRGTPKRSKTTADEPPQTPKRKVVESEKAKSTPKAASKDTPKSTPRKAKEPVVIRPLPKDDKALLVPIDVNYEGDKLQGKLEKNGAYSHTLKLQASSSFRLVSTVLLNEGPYEGHQAILIEPAKPFPFTKLQDVIKARIYSFYFAPNGKAGKEIAVEGKRTADKSLYAKAYAEGSKNRVALLCTNKEIYASAVEVLYSHSMMLESTSTLIDFLLQQSRARAHITSVSVKHYIKSSSRNAMHSLSELGKLEMLHIASGVSSDSDAHKAGKQFYFDAHKLLGELLTRKGNKAAALDVISFGPQALVYTDEDEEKQPWDEEMIGEFKDTLYKKM